MRQSPPSEMASTIGGETPATDCLLHAQPNLTLSGCFEVTGMEGVDRIRLAHGRNKSWGIVNRVLILGVVQNAGISSMVEEMLAFKDGCPMA